MMVNTPRGMFVVTDIPRDLSELCREYISDEVADLVYASITEVEENKRYEEMKFNSDFSALEGENEYYRNCLDEVNSQLQQLSYTADQKPGLSKKKVLEEIDKIWASINKIL